MLNFQKSFSIGDLLLLLFFSHPEFIMFLCNAGHFLSSMSTPFRLLFLWSAGSQPVACNPFGSHIRYLYYISQ